MLAIIRLELETLNSLFFNLFIMLHPFVMALPNVAHLSNGTKVRTFKFIQKMIKVIRTLYKFGSICLNCKLNFTDHFLKKQVDHDVIIIIIEPVFHSQDSYF